VKSLIHKAFAIAAVLGIAYLLHSAFQYRNASTTMGTVTHVGQRICLYYDHESWRFGCDGIAVKMSYKDGDIDREVDVRYTARSRHARYHGLLPPAAVGTQVQLVYVPGRPWLTRLAVNHIRGWGLAWFVCLLALFCWMMWRGDDHPLVAWVNSRRNNKNEEREWRDIQPIDSPKK
jgi:hypothetical protein